MKRAGELLLDPALRPPRPSRALPAYIGGEDPLSLSLFHGADGLYHGWPRRGAGSAKGRLSTADGALPGLARSAPGKKGARKKKTAEHP